MSNQNSLKDAILEALRLAQKTGRQSPFIELLGNEAIAVEIVPDYDCDTFANDSDCYGKLEMERRDRSRPEGFNGAAVKLVGRDVYWWQPPMDVVNMPEQLEALRKRVQGWLRDEWSYVGIVVTLLSAPCDCCGARKESDASLWRIESDSGEDYFEEVIGDLVHGLLVDTSHT